MAETELLTAARGFIAAMDEWDGPSSDWQRLEEKEGGRVDRWLKMSKWFAEQVNDAAGHVLAEDTRNVPQAFSKLKTYVAQAADFDIVGDNRTQFVQIRDSVRSQSTHVLKEMGTWALQHAALRADRPAGELQETLGEVKTILNRIRELEKAAEQATEGAQSAAAKAGAAVWVQDFEKCATAAKKTGTVWLWITGLMAFLTASMAGIAWWTAFKVPTSAESWLWLRPLPGKLFFFSLLTYATVWCGRRSLAEHHNFRVNVHRANSLKTVQAFRESANAEATKDAIVLEAARAVFENVQTGDLGASSEGSSVARTIELVRPLGEHKG